MTPFYNAVNRDRRQMKLLPRQINKNLYSKVILEENLKN